MDEYHIWGAWHHARESPPLSWPLALYLLGSALVVIGVVLLGHYLGAATVGLALMGLALVGGLLPFGVAVILLYRSRRK